MYLDTQLKADAPNGDQFRTVQRRAERFEKLGFDAVWTFESSHDPFLPLALAASATSRLALGTNIAVAFGRSPFATAQTAWNLQSASGGRMHLGLGTQVRAHVERRFSMPFEHPAARVTDYIRCVRAIWETFQHDTRPNYEGPFYRFKLMNPFFNPGPVKNPKIPIYLAGVNRRICRAAGEVADGFHVHPMHSVGYLKDIVRPALDEGARTRGLRVDDLVLYAPVFAISGESEAERLRQEKEVRRQIAFYGSTPNYRALLEYEGYPELGKTLSAHARAGEWDRMIAKVPDQLLDACALAAPLAQLGKRMSSRYHGILDRVSLYFPIADDAADAPWTDFVRQFRQEAA